MVGQGFSGKYVAPYAEKGDCQGVAMHATDVALLLAPLVGKAPPIGVMTAEAEETAVVAAEIGATSKGTTAATSAPKQGIYEFPDAQQGGRTYVGQSSNLPRRIGQQTAAGKRAADTPVSTTSVAGGKTAREVAEQRRINQLGGTQNVPGSRTSNKRNPIGPARQKKVEEKYGPVR